MKKFPLILAILFFLGAGVAVAYSLDRFRSAAEFFGMAKMKLDSMQGVQDMEKLRDESEIMNLDLDYGGKAKQAGMLGMGGAGVLLVGSVILFLKSRRPHT